ncbi:MAG: hypothetical protein REI09_05290 [Candidatus Dactylopiibacterium sp.]|nr:hypothetical protein [Candidatus Dactylopiibacterium sp.]
MQRPIEQLRTLFRTAAPVLAEEGWSEADLAQLGTTIRTLHAQGDAAGIAHWEGVLDAAAGRAIAAQDARHDADKSQALARWQAECDQSPRLINYYGGNA